ncbi:AAA family ATPase [bacterium]|nr:AAA family ATPase [bacterium]
MQITINHFGPINELDGQLSSRAQNLIYARNGTGKSFISRAFLYLDFKGQDLEIENAPLDLISDESPIGSFSFGSELVNYGSIKVTKDPRSHEMTLGDKIFHVFCHDFVQNEVHEQDYSLKGVSKKSILIDRENIEINKIRTEIEEKSLSLESIRENLRKALEVEKAMKLRDEIGINPNLNEYKSLKANTIAITDERPRRNKKTLAQISKDLTRLQNLPSDIRPIRIVNTNLHEVIDWADVELLLERETPKSELPLEVINKIEEYPEFYKIGNKIIIETFPANCPFCEQNISQQNVQLILKIYSEYFAGEEEKHRLLLQKRIEQLKNLENDIIQINYQSAKQIAIYSQLKLILPDYRETSLTSVAKEVTTLQNSIQQLVLALSSKKSKLNQSHIVRTSEMERTLDSLINDVTANNVKVTILNEQLQNTDNARRKLQREACRLFAEEWILDNWSTITSGHDLEDDIKALNKRLQQLEEKMPTEDVYEKISKTFKYLLRYFFEDKYVFDEKTSEISLGSTNFRRGLIRSLSDGEKSIIAFCYFIASIHGKVSKSSQYKNVFLVIDDPVNSLSFDYIYDVAQIIKNLTISEEGTISVNPSKISDAKFHRPDMLILTHSSYYYNMLLSNRAVKDESAFLLEATDACHRLHKQSVYIAPFQQQLMLVHKVSIGEKKPDVSVGNSIRSVLEAVGRFCYPKKSLTDFLTIIAGEEGISIKSVMINSLSHGTYFDESPTDDDLLLACKDTINVVDRFAKGQLDLL